MKFSKTITTLCAALWLAAPSATQGGVVFSIIDADIGGSSIPFLVGTSPYGFSASSLLIQGALESLDLHGEYLSTMNIPNGTPLVFNINFIGPQEPGGLASDTLSIVFIGHTPTPQEPNNVSVDIHFRSDQDPFTLPLLTGGTVINVTEIEGELMFLGGLIAAQGGPPDFAISVQSGVPEPSALFIAGSGLVLIGLSRIRRGRRN